MKDKEKADIGLLYITNPPIFMFLSEKARLAFSSPDEFVGMFPCMPADELIGQLAMDYPDLLVRVMEVEELKSVDFPLNIGAIISPELFTEDKGVTIPVH